MSVPDDEQPTLSKAQRSISLEILRARAEQTYIAIRERDYSLESFLSKLFYVLYEAHEERRQITTGEAHRLIPVKHESTSGKYLAEAERLGFVSFAEHPIDRRKILVIATPKLLEYIDGEIETSCVEIKCLIEKFKACG